MAQKKSRKSNKVYVYGQSLNCMKGRIIRQLRGSQGLLGTAYNALNTYTILTTNPHIHEEEKLTTKQRQQLNSLSNSLQLIQDTLSRLDSKMLQALQIKKSNRDT